MTDKTERERIARIVEPDEYLAYDGMGFTSLRNLCAIENALNAADRLIAAGFGFKGE